MKLYFYFLETYGLNKGIKSAECEVTEKPKTYHAVSKFPTGYYYSRVSKEDIGHICGYANDVVITTEPNFELAKRLFREKAVGKVRVAKKRLESEESILKAIEESEVANE